MIISKFRIIDYFGVLEFLFIFFTVIKLLVLLLLLLGSMFSFSLLVNKLLIFLTKKSDIIKRNYAIVLSALL